MSSKLIQMCVALLGRRHLVNAHKVNAGWLILFGYKTALCFTDDIADMKLM